jgi:two-component system response regulator AtoC
MRILVIDDEEGIRRTLQAYLAADHDVSVAKNGAEALELIQKSNFELLLCDQQMPQITGLELLIKVKQVSPLSSFILMTAYGNVDLAIQAIRAGADDYLAKPIEFEELSHRINRLVELRLWKTQVIIQENGPGLQFIGHSPFAENARKFVQQVASVPSPVLILGPSGTGKEVMSKLIQSSGVRAKKPFIAVNCASLNEQLVESELFGHEKGAFTGAINAKPGKFELASGGTLFLDEIGELPLTLQAKLLRVLQEKEFTRLGGTRTIKTDARVVTATHRSLKKMIEQGQFREDLYFRLNVLTFEMHALKDRTIDLPLLIDYFWNQLSLELGMKASLSNEAKSALVKYNFPGNIRELRNIIERLIVLVPEGGLVDVVNLPAELGEQNNLSRSGNSSNGGQALAWAPGVGLEEWMNSLERAAIELALQKTGNNQVKAAALLGLNRATLQYKMKKFLGNQAA